MTSFNSGLYTSNRYHDTILSTPNDFRFWGKTFLILIPVIIVVYIIILIIFSIINKIVTNEDAPSFSDERDKLIELKATRISHFVFEPGFFLAMGRTYLDPDELQGFLEKSEGKFKI